MPRGRRPSVRYWPSRKGGGYFCTLGGTRYELALGPDDAPNGPVYLAALEKFTKLLRLGADAGTPDYSLGALLTRYREHLLAEFGPARLKAYENRVKDFARHFSELPVGRLLPLHLDQWFSSHPAWGPGTRNNAGAAVNAALNWAVRRGYVPSNPLAGRLQLPRQRYRGREARLSPELCRLLVDCAPAPFRLFVTLLWQTGCRPVELREAKASHLRGDKLVFPANPPPGEYRHKNAKTGRDRVIHLSPGVLVVPADGGHLLRTVRGRPWIREKVGRYWKKALDHPAVTAYLKEHGIPRRSVSPYSFRHTWATEWLESGRSIHTAAELLGTSVAMLEKCYGHPDEGAMARHYRDFLGGRHHGSM